MLVGNLQPQLSLCPAAGETLIRLALLMIQRFFFLRRPLVGLNPINSELLKGKEKFLPMKNIPTKGPYSRATH